MKYVNKIKGKIQSILWIGYFFAIIQGQVVITEYFINSAEGTQNPQFIEL